MLTGSRCHFLVGRRRFGDGQGVSKPAASVSPDEGDRGERRRGGGRGLSVALPWRTPTAWSSKRSRSVPTTIVLVDSENALASRFGLREVMADVTEEQGVGRPAWCRNISACQCTGQAYR